MSETKKDKESEYSSLEEYLVQGEPQQQERARNWATAIGLQAVDGLETSEYLNDVALQNIAGKIDAEASRQLIARYYEQNGSAVSKTEEADKVSANINILLAEKSFSFSPNGLAGIHRRLFTGIFNHAGTFRTVNITKKEWVLGGDTVIYGPYTDLLPTLEYDLEKEKVFIYTGLTQAEIVAHLSRFVAGIWQIHPFREGNTRTTAVFVIKYLRQLGFDINNEPFERYAKYFRDSLVRANYRNLPKGIEYDFMGLERFFSNVLCGTDYELRKRYLHIDAPKLGIVDPTCGVEVPPKYPPSTPQVEKLVVAIGREELSASDIRERLGLKDRKNFKSNYLDPALQRGMIMSTVPDKPTSSRQRYRLTPLGLSLLSQLGR